MTTFEPNPIQSSLFSGSEEMVQALAEELAEQDNLSLADPANNEVGSVGNAGNTGTGGEGEGESTSEGELEPSTPVEEIPVDEPGEIDGGVDPEPNSEPDPNTEPTGIDLNTLSERYFGRRLDESEASGLLAIQRDLSEMAKTDPLRFQQVTALLNGNPLPQTQAPAVQQPAQITPVQPLNQPAPIPIPEYVDPEYAAAIQPVVDANTQLQARLDAIEQQNQQAEFERQSQWQANRAAQINNAQQTWRDSKQLLSPEEYIAFDAKVVNKHRQTGGQLLEGYILANNGDISAGTQAFLEAEYLATPEFREREAHLAAGTIQTDQANQRQRTKKSTALSGGGGGKPAPTQDQAGYSKDPNKNMENMTKAIEEFMNPQ